MRFTHESIVATMSTNVSRIGQAAAASEKPSTPVPDMPGALEFLKTHPRANISHVARQFHVHRRTLSNHWVGRSKLVGRKRNGGQNKIMNPVYTQAIFLYIENQAHAGFAATREMIQGAIGYLLAQEEPPRPMPSTNWTYQFLKGLDLVQKAKTRPLELKRALAQDPATIKAWFNDYVQRLEYYEIYWIHIWNFDEGGFRVGCIKQGDVWILAYMEPTVSSTYNLI